MDYILNYIELENFKSYSNLQRITLSDLSILLGANSSGKSSALQALLVLKQTLECNSHDIELLLSGKYVALGDYDEVINHNSNNGFRINLGFSLADTDFELPNCYAVKYLFSKKKNKSLTELSNVDVCFDDLDISLIRTTKDYFSLFKNEELLPIFVSIQDLHLAGFYIRYDTSFNKLFVELINSIKKLQSGEKTATISSDTFVSYNEIYHFFLTLMYNKQLNDNYNYVLNDNNIQVKELSDKLTELVDCYLEQLCPIGITPLKLPKEVKSNIFYDVIMSSKKQDQFTEIYQHFDQQLKDYKDSYSKDDISNYDGIELFNDISSYNLNTSSTNYDLNTILYFLDIFYKDYETQLRKLFFLGPIRENPKGLYSIGFEQDPKYVGPTGSNFASVLLHENREKNYILPKGIECTTLCDALNEWAMHLNIASSIKVSPATSFGIKVSVSDTQNRTADIMNVGIGTSQVLPVLITGLLSEKNETLIFEQPELHLHPFAQGRLSDFFVSLANNKRRIIVETHSENIILRLRYHILKNNINNNSVAVNFFQNTNGTQTHRCNISGFGVISYPEDFRDETQELLNDLLIATINKNN